MRRLAIVITATLLAGPLAGIPACSSNNPPPPKIVVFAAASLKTAFTGIADRFKAANGAEVDFDFGGSSDLATQLNNGAAADVFASADTANMDKVAKTGLLAGSPVNFASNTLVIVVARGNPKNITSLRDLTRPGLSVVVCAQPVPCGSAARRVEDSAGVQLTPVSEETSVTDVLNKVTTGQADAGLVYVSDARSAGDKVTTVQFPEAASAVNVYPIAVLKGSAHPDLAPKFVDLVTGAEGQNILGQAGFAKP